jgi:hypothetical protein
MTDRDKALTGSMAIAQTQESSSAKVQAAVRGAGGLQAVINLIHGGWGDLSAPGRRAYLEGAMAAALRELEVINATEPESARAAPLRASVERQSTELRDCIRDNEAATRQRAHQCVLGAMGGERMWLTQLATHAGRVNQAFSDAINAAL